MKSFTSLAEFRYALLLALAVGGWLLLFRSWQQEHAEQTSQHGWEGEAAFVVIIPVYLLFLFTCFGALAYLSHAWQRWRNPVHPPAGKVIFMLLFSPFALTYLGKGLSWLISLGR
jgi:hypothetical protein